MNEYLITFQCKYEDGIFTTSDVFSSRFPLCKELVQSINEYIENKFKTKAFSILNIVCLSKQEDLENEKLKKQLKHAESVIRFYAEPNFNVSPVGPKTINEWWENDESKPIGTRAKRYFEEKEEQK